jgi:hypothetical protein
VRRQLTREQFVKALDSWTGRMVAVRVVTEGDHLVAVFRGELGARSDEKRPSQFWPLATTTTPRHPDHAESSGVYLHPERFEGAAVHTGGLVLELRQSGVTLNVRRR